MHSGEAGNGELPGKAKGSGLIALPPIRHPAPPAKLLAPRSLALARAMARGKMRSKRPGSGRGIGLGIGAGMGIGAELEEGIMAATTIRITKVRKQNILVFV